MRISKGIGIDLGTTNSAVAMLDVSDAEIILYKDKLGRATVPSVVWFDRRQKDKDKQIVVGHAAFARRGSSPPPITSIKRRMGLQATVTLDGQPLSPEVVSSYILRELRQRMEETLADRREQDLGDGTYLVDRAIVTVPAYFDLPQIEATRKAGELAELQVIELLHEPVAAAVYYSWKHDIGDGTFLVYDLGGGTFDVSVLRRTAGEFEVLGISGDNFLGGDDFDRLLAGWLRDRLAADEYVLDLNVEKNPDDALRFAGLVALAEQAKKALTSTPTYQMRDQSTLTDQDGQRVIIDIPVEREVFESLIRSHIERTIPLCWEALAKAHQKAGISLQDIDHVCLVGGSTYVPLVQDMVAAHLCSGNSSGKVEILSSDQILNQVAESQRETARGLLERGEKAKCAQPAFDEPDTCVALGAAIRAASAGLMVYDADRRVRVHFQGQGGTARQSYMLRGTAVALEAGHSLEGGRIEIEAAESGFHDEQALGEGGAFHFRNIPLQGGALNALTLRLFDRDNQAVAVLGRTIAQTTEFRQIGGMLSTAVLSKPILLEGLEQGRLTRGVLLAEGTALPASAQFRFEVSDTTASVRFPLYQASRIIKEVAVELKQSLAKGAPIYFTIHCDEQLNLKIEGEIGAHRFDVAVGAPPPVPPPTPQDLIALRMRFMQKLHGMSAEDAEPQSRIFAGIMADIEEAMRAGDEPKAISKVADAEGLIKAIDLRMPRLEPPWEVFQKMVAQVSDLLQIALDSLPNLKAESNPQAALDMLIEQARAARARADQQEYAEIVGKVQALGESIQQQLAKQSQKHIPPEIEAAAALQEAEKRSMAIQLFAFVNGRQDLAQRVGRLVAELPRRRAQVAGDPRDVLMWVTTVHTELNKIVRELQPEESSALSKDLVNFTGMSKPKE